MANTQLQPNDTLSGILGSMQFPQAPGVQTSPTSPTYTPTSSGSTPTTAAELDSWLKDWQNTQLTAAGSWDSYFEGQGTTEMDRIREQIMPGEDIPKPPSLVERFQDMRAEYGLDELEQSLADLRAEEREQQAIRRERIEGTFQERDRMSAIQGQVSEIERQEMQRLDFLGREISYRVDMINSAYNVINLTTQLMQMDWQNAKEWWQTKFNANMAIYQQLRSEFESDRDFAQRQLEYEQSVAKSNLQIYMDMITNGQLTYDQMDSATQMAIKKLEIQSGLGAGFLSKIQMDPNKQIKSITNRTVGGVQYADILRIDPRTGQITVETIRLGAVSVGGSGGGTSGADAQAAQLQQARQGAAADLNAKVGKDGKVSPSTWNRVRSQWIAMGYDPNLFNQYFGHYVNTTHGGYDGVGQSATQPSGSQTGGPASNVTPGGVSFMG
jgi:hypothetical protein